MTLPSFRPPTRTGWFSSGETLVPSSAASMGERHAGLNLRVKLPGRFTGRRSRSKSDAAPRLPPLLGVAFGRCTPAPPQPLQGGRSLPAERRLVGPFASSDSTSLAASVAIRSSSSSARGWRRLWSCLRVTSPAPRRRSRPPWWRASTEGAARLNPGQARLAACRWKVSILRPRWSSWPHGDWPVERSTDSSWRPPDHCSGALTLNAEVGPCAGVRVRVKRLPRAAV